jgi:ABC-type multidrug transport system fused ATPase/permease subunit
MKKWIHLFALVLGAVLSLAGLWFVGIYVSDAIFKRLGEPDQSLVFWYLPILFIGIAGIVSGVVSFLWAFGHIRRTKNDSP